MQKRAYNKQLIRSSGLAILLPALSLTPAREELAGLLGAQVASEEQHSRNATHEPCRRSRVLCSDCSLSGG